MYTGLQSSRRGLLPFNVRPQAMRHISGRVDPRQLQAVKTHFTSEGKKNTPGGCDAAILVTFSAKTIASPLRKREHQSRPLKRREDP